MGKGGDATRAHVLDAPMLAALPATGRALDIGCGEGRFCRMMASRGMQAVGVEPTDALLRAQAQKRDPNGTHLAARAEELPFDDASFDVTVFYLSLIDIPQFRAAISEAARVLRQGGRKLIANLHAYVSARPRIWPNVDSHWVETGDLPRHMAIDDMQEERSTPSRWDEISVTNYHRPLSAYIQALLGAALILRDFADPPATGPDPDVNTHYHRMPWAFFMAWQQKQGA
ncbi:MAG: class I SAM-dependent methyltransferase [Rhodobacteraceae bacterium]|nr:class I SAM-dependent methyltransferase [Paracoccaceae bacterium]